MRHVPRTISKVRLLFIWCGGSIQGRVNGHYCYAADLKQGGLKIPCILKYSVEDKKEGTKTNQIVYVKLGISTADSADDFVNLDFLVSAEWPSAVRPLIWHHQLLWIFLC